MICLAALLTSQAERQKSRADQLDLLRQQLYLIDLDQQNDSWWFGPGGLVNILDSEESFRNPDELIAAMRHCPDVVKRFGECRRFERIRIVPCSDCNGDGVTDIQLPARPQDDEPRYQLGPCPPCKGTGIDYVFTGEQMTRRDLPWAVTKGRAS